MTMASEKGEPRGQRGTDFATSAPKGAGDQEADAGAGLRNLEIAGRRGDEDAFEMRRHVAEREQHGRDLGGDGLHRGHNLLAHRQQEKSVEEREGDTASDRLAEDRDRAPLKHQQQAEMAGEIDSSPSGSQGARPRRDREAATGGGVSLQIRKALPDQQGLIGDQQQ